MQSIRNILTLAFVAATAGCAAPPPPPPAPVPASEETVEAPAAEFSYGVVWSAMANVAVRTEHGYAAVPHLFTRLEVLQADSTDLRIRCSRCENPVEGWVEQASVVYDPGTPVEAAVGELAPFLLAIRKAALERDLSALQPVMFERFTFTFGGGGGPADAFNRWRFEGYRTLDQLAPLLDRGLATFDGEIWAAPPEFATRDGYMGLRAGFRRVDGRWQWIYLVAGD